MDAKKGDIWKVGKIWKGGDKGILAKWKTFSAVLLLLNMSSFFSFDVFETLGPLFDFDSNLFIAN